MKVVTICESTAYSLDKRVNQAIEMIEAKGGKMGLSFGLNPFFYYGKVMTIFYSDRG